ncbi:phage tail protein [Bacillus carboniphilus]|uniref:Phage tail protein n=1 Tax=Bacillus carboniphilus TaxID=86663 RepID=A0ABY9JT35_9BACI|nr:phage tail protein [Bacillus carboniphilus]WLR41668.1 phage tail protein [Bacillus carboniphilus]
MLYIFNKNEQLETIIMANGAGEEQRSTPFYYKEAEHIEQLNKDHSFTFWVPANHPDSNFIKEEKLVAMKDQDGDFRLFVIKELDEVHEDLLYKEVFCMVAWKDELADEPLSEMSLQEVTLSEALSDVLKDTRFEKGEVAELGQKSIQFHYESVLDGIQKIVETWGGEIKDHIVVKDNQISGRYINLLTRRGEDTGKRFEMTKDLQKIRRTIVSYPKTALIGRGKSEETADGLTVRRSFKNVEWKMEAGDPANKPIGQEWIGDKDALSRYGRENGTRHRFGFFDASDIEDEQDLLRQTWQALQERTSPLVSYELSVNALEELSGFEHEKVRLGDTVFVIDRQFVPEILIEARVIEIQRLLHKPERTIVKLGNFLPLFTDDQRLDKLEAKVNDQAGVWSQKPQIDDASFVDQVPRIPTNFSASGGFRTIALKWDFDPSSSVACYELFASQVNNFNPDESNLLWRGKAGGYGHKVDTNDQWYYKVRAVNTHGTTSAFSPQVTATTAKIVSDDILLGAINADLIVDLSIDAEKLAKEAVTEEKIGKLAVGNAAIQNGAITNAKIEKAAIDTAQIKDGAIKKAKIEDAAIDGAKIAEASITAAHIDNLNADKINAGILDAQFVRIGSKTTYESDEYDPSKKANPGDVATAKTEAITEAKANSEEAVGSLQTYVDNSFKDGIIEQSEAKVLQTYIVQLETAYTDLENRKNNAYNNGFIGSTEKSNLATKWSDFANNGHETLISAINSAIADGKTTASEKANVDSKFSTYKTMLSSLVESLEKASESIIANSNANSKSHAETKASEAEGRANSHAEEKASEALTQAKAHTDGEIETLTSVVNDVKFRTTDTAIISTVTKSSTYTNALNGKADNSTVTDLGERVELAESNIEQTADGLTLKVSTDKIISTINQSPERIEIDASKIDISGAVTFSSFDTNMKSKINNWDSTSSKITNWTHSSNRTYIDGGKIYTDTITARHINITSLSSLTANLGKVTTGHLEGVKITSNNSDGYTQIEGDRILTYEDNGNAESNRTVILERGELNVYDSYDFENRNGYEERATVFEYGFEYRRPFVSSSYPDFKVTKGDGKGRTLYWSTGIHEIVSGDPRTTLELRSSYSSGYQDMRFTAREYGDIGEVVRKGFFGFPSSSSPYRMTVYNDNTHSDSDFNIGGKKGFWFRFKTSSDGNGHSTLQGANRAVIKFLKTSNTVQIRNSSDNGYADLHCSDLTETSSRDLKKNIVAYEDSVLESIASTPVYNYHLLNDLDEEMPRLGIILDEAPVDIVSPSGAGISNYSMVSYLWKAIQELNDKVIDLENQLQGEDQNGTNTTTN